MSAEPRGGWLTPRLPELVGAKQACEILGIGKMTLTRWLEPGTGEHGPDNTYLIPPVRVGTRSVWAKTDLEHFAETTGRRRAPAAVA